MKAAFYSVFVLCFAHKVYSILQGTTVSQSNAQFVASVRLRRLDRERFGSGYLCTATVINNWNVLTAASCVAPYNPSDVQVAMGDINLTRRSVVIRVRRFAIHPNFTQNRIGDNIAVLRLDQSIRGGSRGSTNRNMHIQPISLSDLSPNQSDSCPFFAWGNGNLLLRAVLPIRFDIDCGGPGTFCAGNLNNGPAVCTRNIGGPFICSNRITGLAIDDSGCGQTGTTGRFISISHNREWISQVSVGSLKAKISTFLLIISFMLNSQSNYFWIKPKSLDISP